MRSLPNSFPSVKLPNFGNVSCISWEKKQEKIKELLDGNGPKNTHLRYDNLAKLPRAFVPFLVVVNAACRLKVT